MWALLNSTPYAADRNWTRDKNGVHWYIVAVRATFTIKPDSQLILEDEQLPPVLEQEYAGEPGKSSLLYDSDLLAVKPSTDVLVIANAHAPGGKAVPSVPVGFRIGTIQKQLLVHGERTYYKGNVSLKMSEPQPFTSCPIRYEYAYGGSDFSDPDPNKHCLDERNPIGRGFARRSAHLVDTLAYAIEYPKGDAASLGPAGFSPIDLSWLPRRNYAGTYDKKWEQSKKPLLPDDYNPMYSLCAPEDQRTDQPLVGGEHFELVNMTPEGRLVFEIPKISLEFTSIFRNRREPHGPKLTTVLVEPEDKRLSLVFQSALRVSATEVDYLDATEIKEAGNKEQGDSQ